jgi:hypothetical protein
VPPIGGIAGTSGDVAPGRPFARRTENVDNDATAARLHRGVDRAAEIDVAEHLEIPGVAPPCLVDRLEVPCRNGTCVVHEDVDVVAGRGQGACVVAAAEIDGMDRHGNVVPRLDRLLGALEIRFRPRREMQVAAFLGKLSGAGQANALGSAGDEGELATQIEIHANLLK